MYLTTIKEKEVMDLGRPRRVHGRVWIEEMKRKKCNYIIQNLFLLEKNIK